MSLDLERRVEQLEGRLAEYHEWLEGAIKDRDRLALDAAWGNTQSIVSIAAFGAVIVLFFRWFEDGGTLVGIASIICATVAASAANIWVNSMRMKEVDRLARLPEWDQM